MIPAGRNGRSLKPVGARSAHLRLAVLVVFLLIVPRLVWLQLARGGAYYGLSEENYVQEFTLRAPRGLIKDRDGEILADNRTSYTITITRTRARDDEKTAALLSEILDIDAELARTKLAEARSSYYGGVVLLEDADLGLVSRVEERQAELPGIKIEVNARRRYLSDDLATHAIGYVSELSDADLPRMSPLGYSPGDIVGRTGVERRYELQLRGCDGAEYWVCDGTGRELFPYEEAKPYAARPGHNLILTIDAAAQRAAERCLIDFDGGAVVALEPSTGEVLVMASWPAVDPNIIVGGLTASEWRAVADSPDHPLMNRATQATYPPGSPFKLITAAVGLETGTIAPVADKVTCTGGYKYGNRVFRCWRPEGHGSVALMKGIVESCDVFFYHLGAKLGVSKLMGWAARCGLGKKTGVDIPGEASGTVPLPSWYDRRYGKGKWSRGVVLNLAIGQGELLVTPLQTACLVCATVNGGTAYRPHLLKRVETYSGRTIGTARRDVAYELPIAPANLSYITKAMVDVVQSPNGTGRQARIDGLELGGKTGTAQNPHGEDHAWFVCFAPAQAPRIVVAVLLEHGGGGGAVAAPVAREVVRAYLGLAGLPAEAEHAESPAGQAAPPGASPVQGGAHRADGKRGHNPAAQWAEKSG